MTRCRGRRRRAGDAAAGLDLGVDGPRDLVTRQQLGRATVVGLVLVPTVALFLGVGRLGFEELRDVVEHEAPALGVAQDAPVATHGLGHEEPADRGWPDHAGGVELHELHVEEGCAGAQGEGVPVSGVLPGVAGHLVGLADAAGRQDDARRLEDDEPSGLAPVAEGAGHPAVVLEDLGDRAFHEHVDTEGDRTLLKGADHLQPGAVADVGEPRIAVATEVALGDQTVVETVEEGAPLLELDDPLGRLLGMQLSHPPVVEHLAAAHGVAEVHLPVVLFPEVAHRGRDAALGHHGVGLAQQRLADDGNPRASVMGRDGGTQTGSAGSDHDHVVVVLLETVAVLRLGLARGDVAGHGVPVLVRSVGMLSGGHAQKNLGSSKVPVASR